jgi:hypothetical protein
VHRRFSDAQIYGIAERIREAVRDPMRGSRCPAILSPRSELPPADEDRVIVALQVLDLLASVR